MTISSLLNITKLIDFAIRLKDSGEAFFNKWAEKAGTDELKIFFRLLAEAIELAKKQEVDAQLFFSDLIKYLPGEYVDTVKQIIVEERNHFTRLSTLEEKLIKPDSRN